MVAHAPAFPHVSEKVPPFMLDTKRRRDDVHDFIDLNEIERKVIDTAEFQRLRYIKQLGFAHLVYQAAEHSRFAHSVGVCHTAKVLVDRINHNHRIIPAAAPNANDGKLSFGSSLPKICWVRRLLIGLAALLHDIPHPPMSHALEHESSVLVKHDDLLNNPQLYIYLFDTGHSAIAGVLSDYSANIYRYLEQNSDSLGLDFSKSAIDEFLTANDLSRKQLLAGLVFEILAFQGRDKHPLGDLTIFGSGTPMPSGYSSSSRHFSGRSVQI